MDSNESKYSIIVIGSGGTGTYFLKEFSRFIAGGLKCISDMYIFDGDVVEDKNLERQSFTKDDVGFNKASVMADALSGAFNLRWVSYSSYLTELEQLTRLERKEITPIIIGCVDNHACRLLLEEYFDKCENICYFDSANEFSTGEVVFGYKINGKVISPYRSHYFPKIKETVQKKRTEMSCEELNEVAPQHIATNMCAGNILLKEICSLFSGNPHPGMVVFDTDNYIQEYMPYVNGNTEIA